MSELIAPDMRNEFPTPATPPALVLVSTPEPAGVEGLSAAQMPLHVRLARRQLGLGEAMHDEPARVARGAEQPQVRGVIEEAGAGGGPDALIAARFRRPDVF